MFAMNVGIITQYYPPEIGAAQARLSELATRFVEHGHTITVLTAMPNYPQGRTYAGYGGFYRAECQPGIRILRAAIYPTNDARMLPRLANYFSFVVSSLLVGSVRLPPIDFLLTESPPLFLGISGYILSRLRRTRWIFNVSDLWPETAVRLGVVGPGLSLDLASALEKFCYSKAWLVTGQSTEILHDIEARFPHIRTYHLSNGVDIQRFNPDARSAEWRGALTANKNDVCIALYAGLHGLAQGLDHVLEAAAQLSDCPNLEIVFVGGGPEKPRLIQRSKQLNLRNVRFLDPLPRSKMPELVSSADIALVPLKAYIPGAVPSKLYECMASGLPIVLSATGEAAEIVEQSKAGIVVSPGNPNALASALRGLARNSCLRTELAYNGRSAAVNCFNRQVIYDEFINYLQQNTWPKVPIMDSSAVETPQ